MAGLEHRYNVEKVNDPEGKHTWCRYFVLDPQHDKRALVALELYADLCAIENETELADDLYAWTDRIRDADVRD